MKDQTTLSSPGNEAIFDLRRGLNLGGDALGAIALKYTPRFDRNGADKLELTASAAVKADGNVYSGEATIKSPDNVVEAKLAAKVKDYVMTVERSSRDSNPVSLIEFAKSTPILGKDVRFSTGIKFAPETTLLAKADIAVHPQLKVTPVLSMPTSSLKPTLVKVEASGVVRGSSIGWKADVTPARNEATLELRESVERGVWVAKATVPTDGNVGSASIAIRREIMF
jgi:hypothetical protein